MADLSGPELPQTEDFKDDDDDNDNTNDIEDISVHVGTLFIRAALP